MATKRISKEAPANKAGADLARWPKGLSIDLGDELPEAASARAMRWHDELLRIADKVEKSESLTDLERDFSAGALRGMATRLLVESPSKPAHAPSKIDPGHASFSVALEMLAQERRGERTSQDRAIRAYLGESSIDASTVAKAIRPWLQQTIAYLRDHMKGGKSLEANS